MKARWMQLNLFGLETIGAFSRLRTVFKQNNRYFRMQTAILNEIERRHFFIIGINTSSAESQMAFCASFDADQTCSSFSTMRTNSNISTTYSTIITAQSSIACSVTHFRGLNIVENETFCERGCMSSHIKKFVSLYKRNKKMGIDNNCYLVYGCQLNASETLFLLRRIHSNLYTLTDDLRTQVSDNDDLINEINQAIAKIDSNLFVLCASPAYDCSFNEYICCLSYKLYEDDADCRWKHMNSRDYPVELKTIQKIDVSKFQTVFNSLFGVVQNTISVTPKLFSVAHIW